MTSVHFRSEWCRLEPLVAEVEGPASESSTSIKKLVLEERITIGQIFPTIQELCLLPLYISSVHSNESDHVSWDAFRQTERLQLQCTSTSEFPEEGLPHLDTPCHSLVGSIFAQFREKIHGYRFLRIRGM